MPIEALAFDAYGTLFDPQSVASAVEAAFPGQGAIVTQVWRQKQLEYSWQRTAMGAFADFRQVTAEALDYAIRPVRPDVDRGVVDDLVAAFDRLALFADARDVLAALKPYRLAVLSNGSRAMLDALLAQAGIERNFEAVVGSDETRVYKPHPAFYQAIVDRFGLPADRIALVSGNGFDLAGARHFGLATIRIERLSPQGLRDAMEAPGGPSSATAFAALRSQMDRFAGDPDAICRSLSDIPAAIAGLSRPTLTAA